MSRSLSFECEWIDQPAAADPLERRTWAGVRIHAAGRAVTRFWDRNSLSENVSIYIPAFPLAKWTVENWWTLLYEPGRSDEIPLAEASPPYNQKAWIRRHCLRAAEAGLLLPRAFLYSDGRGVCANWFADEPGAYARMPGEFLDEGLVRLDFADAEEGLRVFIRQVVDRLDGINEPRAAKFLDDWNAIVDAEYDERAFCRAAGRLGLDPYRVSEWPDGVLELIEDDVSDDVGSSIAADFLEAIDVRKGIGAATPSAVWRWARATGSSLDLRASPSAIAEPSFVGHPAKNAYRIAQDIRRTLDAAGHGPLAELSAVTEKMRIPGLKFESRNHLVSRNVHAAVGWQNGRNPVIAGPAMANDANKRFLEARALYLATFGCQAGPRLVTTAHTWDQKASRAFAAELLAPQAELVARVEQAESTEALNAAVATLAAEYNVSSKVIEHQLENAGFALDDA